MGLLDSVVERVIRKLRIIPLQGEIVWNPPPCDDREVIGMTVTVLGARPGDFAIASFDNRLGVDFMISAQVADPDKVLVKMMNVAGGLFSVPSGTLRVMVFKK